MHIVLVGGSGYLGHLVNQRLTADGHTVVIVSSRGLAIDSLTQQLRNADVVVNLSGANLGGHRWSSAFKREAVSSRVDTTRTIVTAITHIHNPSPNPSRTSALEHQNTSSLPAFICMSAVGYYGNTTVPSNEGMGAGQSFMAQLCVEWERAANEAQAYTRVVNLRMAVILDPRSGALKKMMLPFKLFIGGPLGWGKQYLAWIHRDDAVEAIVRVITDPTMSGPYNVCATEAVTMRTFTRTLGKILRRPSFFFVPPMLLRILLGDMADTVLQGQNVVPMRLLGTSFTFKFPQLEDALRDLL